MTDYIARIKLLEKQLSEKDERIFMLEADMGIHDMPPLVFGFTKNEAIMYGVLMARKHCPKEVFMTALYCLHHGGEAPEIKIVDVFMCKLRAKLEAYGIEVTTLWGVGYAMTEENKEKCRAIEAQDPLASKHERKSGGEEIKGQKNSHVDIDDIPAHGKKTGIRRGT